MGFLYDDLKERNEVYSELINHFKNKIVEKNRNTDINEYIMEFYDNEVNKAERGDAYLLKSLFANGFGGLSIGLGVGGLILDHPVVILGALVSAGVSAYNYIRFKNLSLSRALGTKMVYAEHLQNILEENSFKYPFKSGEMSDYQFVEDFVEILKQDENQMLS